MKILVIGYFGFSTNQLDGQTVKTRSVYKVLSSKYDVDYFDTECLKQDKLKIVLLIKNSLKYNNIYFLGGENNLKFFFPLLFMISKITSSKIVYVVIGGWLFDFLASNNLAYTYMLKNITSVLVETNYLKSKLLSRGVNKVETIPNFRIIPHSIILRKDNNLNILKIVFMARITKSKGIYLLFDLLKRYESNSENFTKKIMIDFYGPIDPKDDADFNKLLNKFNSLASYKGILDPSDIYSTLPNYDLLILPTFYEGEGFPGSIIDAYYCGLPVIATNWKQIPEFVRDGETGFLIDYNINQLTKKIKLLMNSDSLLSKMKNNALEYSTKFSAAHGLDVLEQSMGLNK